MESPVPCTVISHGHIRLHHSNTLIMWVNALCNVHTGVDNLKWLCVNAWEASYLCVYKCTLLWTKVCRQPKIQFVCNAWEASFLCVYICTLLWTKVCRQPKIQFVCNAWEASFLCFCLCKLHFPIRRCEENVFLSKQLQWIWKWHCFRL